MENLKAGEQNPFLIELSNLGSKYATETHRLGARTLIGLGPPIEPIIERVNELYGKMVEGTREQVLAADSSQRVSLMEQMCRIAIKSSTALNLQVWFDGVQFAIDVLTSAIEATEVQIANSK